MKTYESDSMTKWDTSEAKVKNIGYPKYDKIIIDDEVVGKKKKIVGYLCPSCNIKMIKLSEEEWFCNRCQHSEYIENVAQNTEALPKPQTMDTAELHAFTTPGPVNPFDKKPVELKGGALALSKKGTIRFTSYYDSSAGKENAD
jgi:ribosomal protein L37AE/L43A